MKIVLRSCSECLFLYYKRNGLLSCTFSCNLYFRKNNDPRFPMDCPLTNKTSIKIDPILTCEKCGWIQDGHCMLYCGKLTIKNNKELRLSVCIDNERHSNDD